MTIPFEVVVVSSDLESRRHLSHILVEQGLDPICTSTLRECHEVLGKNRVGVVFCDPHVSDGSYRDLLSAYRLTDRKPRVVVTSRGADWEEFKEAMRCGAFDVISSPCRPTDVEWMVIQARRDERHRLEAPAPARTERMELARAVNL
ncbi:MAG TPA: response regulator [Candidatus Aquilonibacter sp.]|nr:response regulator [Candidatus Aquilonibacter sp.]